jgi:hypothetical protein
MRIRWPFVLAALVASFVIGWQLEDCRYIPEPQPAILPGRLP